MDVFTFVLIIYDFSLKSRIQSQLQPSVQLYKVVSFFVCSEGSRYPLNLYCSPLLYFDPPKINYP